MQVCVYPVLAISRIRAATAVERRNAGLCLLGPSDFKIRPGNAVERRYVGLCLPGPADFKDSVGNRCGA